MQTVSRWVGHRDGGKLILQIYSDVREIHSQRMAALLTDGEPENVVAMKAGGGVKKPAEFPGWPVEQVMEVAQMLYTLPPYQISTDSTHLCPTNLFVHQSCGGTS